jgi:ankyrin repeat protein
VIIENNYRNMGKLDDIVLDQLPDQEHLIKVDIAGNVWVEVIDQYHDEPLLKAVYYRQVDKALGLIEAGADVNTSDEFGNTPLMLAVNQRLVMVVEQLLKAKANVNAADNIGLSALMHGVIQNDRYLIELLLDAGADINQADGQGQTPVMFAAKHADADLVVWMNGKGAALKARDSEGRGVFEHAIENRNPAVVSGLPLKECGIKPIDFICALMNGNDKAAIAYIRMNMPVNFHFDDGISALIYALRFCDIKVAKQMIDKGAIIDQVAKNGLSALMTAAKLGSVQKVNLLFDAGYKDIHVKDINGHSAVVYAFKSGHDDVVESLLMHGANPSDLVLSQHLKTGSLMASSMLIESVRKQNYKMVKVLLQHNANVNQICQGQTAMMATYAAELTAKHNMAEILINKGALFDSSRFDESGFINPNVRSMFCAVRALDRKLSLTTLEKLMIESVASVIKKQCDPLLLDSLILPLGQLKESDRGLIYKIMRSFISDIFSQYKDQSAHKTMNEQMNRLTCFDMKENQPPIFGKRSRQPLSDVPVEGIGSKTGLFARKLSRNQLFDTVTQPLESGSFGPGA